VSIVRFPLERRLPRRLVSIRELQDQFGMSERWFRYRIAEGMPTHRWGSRLRFDASEVEAWMKERYG
jgi:predicted DNA-binding transcriptional regulator AlpA